MRDAVVFDGASNLDFQDIRANVIRIPEVVLRIREAQAIWDQAAPQALDLANFLASEDAVFLGHIRLKNFATAIVQMGLLDRYLKYHKAPQFFIGVTNGDSALKVATGQMTFADLIRESPVLGQKPARPVPQFASALGLPVLAGMQIAEYGVFAQQPDGGYKRTEVESADVERMLLHLIDQEHTRKVVLIGPGQSIFNHRISDLTARDVQISESIDLDPMLAWFWGGLRETRMAAAN